MGSKNENREIIKLFDVVKVYSESKVKTTALRGITVNLSVGSVNLIVGPSGSGKSTLLNMIGLLDSPTTGDLIVDGESTRNWSRKEILNFRRENIGFIFQNSNLFPNLNVMDNLLVSAHNLKKTQKERKDLAASFLRKVNLEEKRNSMTWELSGGQKQRIAIVSALIKNPRIVIADEPTAELDIENKIKVIELLMRLREEIPETCIIIASHDDIFKRYVDRVLNIQDGLLIADGQLNSIPQVQNSIQKAELSLQKISEIIACPNCKSKLVKKFYDPSKNVHISGDNVIGTGTIFCNQCQYNETKEYIFYKIEKTERVHL